MSNMTGSFDSITFASIEGYRIAAAYKVEGGGGFTGDFYVYLFDRTEAPTKFTGKIDIGKAGDRRRGTLDFKDGYRTYSFKDIDLEAIEAGITRNQRYRLFEFKYRASAGQRNPLDVTLNNTAKRKLPDNSLKQDYDATVGKGSKEHLLGFRARLAADRQNVYRFATLRTGDNSMLSQLIETNKATSAQKALPEFKIDFSQGEVAIKEETISHILLHESYGSFHAIPLPSLQEVSSGVDDETLDPLLKVDLSDHTTETLLMHEKSKGPEKFVDGTTQVVSLVFHSGELQELGIQ